MTAEAKKTNRPSGKRQSKINVCLVQSAPVLFDLVGTIDKIESLVAQCKTSDPDLILFPEAFIPAYPKGLHFGAPVGSRSDEGRELWLRYWQNSVDLEGAETERLGAIAAKAGCYVAIGVIEKETVGKGSLYCTLLYFNPKGKLIGKHRKLKPTAAERIIWSEGDGTTLSTFETPIGVIGGLICWENYMPEARMAMYQQGVQIYLAPTADHRESWQATMKHIALEGRCYVLGCNQFFTKDMYPADLPGISDLEKHPEILSRGGSVIVDPMGQVVSGPVFDKEEILTATLDLDVVAKSKMDFDVIGHYSRPDVFTTEVRGQPGRVRDEGE